jgi:uncharacterized protein
MNYENLLPEEIIGEFKKDENVLAVAFFGSFVRGEKYRDIDLVIFLNEKLSNLKMSKIRLKYSSIILKKFDVHVFQQLPVYIRSNILKDYKLLFCKNEDLIYEIAISTIQEFGFYKKLYEEYLKNVS